VGIWLYSTAIDVTRLSISRTISKVGQMIVVTGHCFASEGKREDGALMFQPLPVGKYRRTRLFQPALKSLASPVLRSSKNTSRHASNRTITNCDMTWLFVRVSCTRTTLLPTSLRDSVSQVSLKNWVNYIDKNRYLYLKFFDKAKNLL